MYPDDRSIIGLEQNNKTFSSKLYVCNLTLDKAFDYKSRWKCRRIYDLTKLTNDYLFHNKNHINVNRKSKISIA